MDKMTGTSEHHVPLRELGQGYILHPDCRALTGNSSGICAGSWLCLWIDLAAYQKGYRDVVHSYPLLQAPGVYNVRGAIRTLFCKCHCYGCNRLRKITIIAVSHKRPRLKMSL